MKKQRKGLAAFVILGLVLTCSMGKVAVAHPSAPLGTFVGYLSWLSGGLQAEAGQQAATRSPNAGNYVAVAKYYNDVAYSYAYWGYYIPN